MTLERVVFMAVAPISSNDRITGVDETVITLAPEAPGATPHAPPRGPAPGRAPDAHVPPSFAASLGPPDLSAQIPREQRSLSKAGILARLAIVVCLGASAFWAWQSYGGLATDMVASWGPPFNWILASVHPSAAPQTPAPAPEQAAAAPVVAAAAPPPAQAASQPAATAQPATAAIAQPATAAQSATAAASDPAAASADRQQIKTMARDLAALRQTVEQLAAGQGQLTRDIAKLQAEKPQAEKPAAVKPDKRKPAHVSTVGSRSDVFDPTQNPRAPGVPRPLGSIVVPPGVPAPVR